MRCWIRYRWSASPGQVGTPLLGTDAFQELDVFGLTMPIVKHSWLVRSVDGDLPRVVADAFRIAREGRPGPVLIDLPKDVQLADASHLPAHVPSGVEPPPAPAEGPPSPRPLPRWPRPRSRWSMPVAASHWAMRCRTCATSSKPAPSPTR